MGGGFGVDLGGLPLDTPLGDLETEGSQGHLTAIRPPFAAATPHSATLPCTAAGPTAWWERRNRSRTASKSGRTPESTG